jgi:hypothetical protein
MDHSSTLLRHGDPLRMWYTMILILGGVNEVCLPCKIRACLDERNVLDSNVNLESQPNDVFMSVSN